MQSSRLIVFLTGDTRQAILAKGNQPRRRDFRGIIVKTVSPNRVELVQLIVQGVSAILCDEQRILFVSESDVVKRGMVRIVEVLFCGFLARGWKLDVVYDEQVTSG
jgi:hypothetical protein